VRFLEAGIATVFFGSGVAALLYQICWQRLLFLSFGIDLESVTIIVSAFMLGLGLGALAGGLLADRYPNRLIPCFALFELGIGLFGLASAAAIGVVADAFVEAPRAMVAVANFAILLVPTSLMGATLPVLTAEAVRRHGGVGRSIGRLYFANTLGAAAGALFLGTGGFAWLGIKEVIAVAATINLSVAAVVVLSLGRRR
jgi:predicted membrane-bound spermidine synthase